MRLQDIAKPESKFFLKFVYGPSGSLWTVMSYTRPQLKTYLHRHYRPRTADSGEGEPCFRRKPNSISGSRRTRSETS